MTPPALVRMSGRIGIPRSARIASASSDVGPLAPSAISLAWIRGAFSSVTWSSRAARTRMSHGSSSSSSFVIRAPVGQPSSEPCSRRVVAHRVDVEPGGVVDAAGDVRDGGHGRAAVDQLVRGDPADVAEALDDALLLGEVPAEPLAGSGDHHHDAGAGRLVPEDRAADRDRLAGDDLGHRVADLHRVRVHHPGHRLLVRRHVGGGNVLLRADHGQEIRGEAARQALELALGQLARIAADTAFRAAVGEAQERALPGHPDCERGALAERHLGVVADAALRRPEHGRVLDAVAGKDGAAAVVELDRNGEHDRPLGVAQALRDRARDVRVWQRQLELGDGGLEQRRVPLEVRVCSGFLDPGHGGQCRDSVSDAGGGSRTRTACEGRPILSRPRLPVPPPRRAGLRAAGL